MLRKLLYLGVFTGLAAAVPAILEKQDAFKPGVGSSARGAKMPEPAVGVALSRADDNHLASRSSRIAADDTGHFSAQFSLNGRPTRALIDTGATFVAINLSTARRLGLRLSPADFVRKVRTANGTISAAPVVLDRVEVGRVSVSRVEALVIEDTALSDTLIGMSFLNRLSRFAVADGAIQLEQ